MFVGCRHQGSPRSPRTAPDRVQTRKAEASEFLRSNTMIGIDCHCRRNPRHPMLIQPGELSISHTPAPSYESALSATTRCVDRAEAEGSTDDDEDRADGDILAAHRSGESTRGWRMSSVRSEAGRESPSIEAWPQAEQTPSADHPADRRDKSV